MGGFVWPGCVVSHSYDIDKITGGLPDTPTVKLGLNGNCWPARDKFGIDKIFSGSAREQNIGVFRKIFSVPDPDPAQRSGRIKIGDDDSRGDPDGFRLA